MRDKDKKQFWITTPQLAALGVISLSLAALAFFLGLMVGRGQARLVEDSVLSEGAQRGLIAAEIEDDTITELLARVEEAAEQHASTVELDFPEALVEQDVQVRLPEPQALEVPELAVVEADQRREVAEPEEVEVTEPEGTTGAEEQVAATAIPDKGWAVQIASYPRSSEAQRHLSALKSGGHSAYLVSALVKGQTWYRVRVGPYETREEARGAQRSLSERLGRRDLLVTGVQ